MKVIKDKTQLDGALKKLDLEKHFSTPPAFRLVQFEKGELITLPDKPLTGFLFLVEGKVKIYGIGDEGNQYYIYMEGTGEMLGDREFVNNTKNGYYTEAACTVVCVNVPFAENRKMLSQDPVFLMYLIGQMSDKLFSLVDVGLGGQTLEERVIIYLKCLDKGSRSLKIGDAISRLPCSRRQLQRVVKKLCEDGTLVKTGKGIYRLLEDMDEF